MQKYKKFIEEEKMLEWLMFAAVLLLVFSKNSPIYATNDWVDSNAFLTVGKGMFNGLVPYKDLFEQKGPFLYLIYGLSSLLGTKSFFGVYFIECLGMAVSLVCSFKLLKLYLPEKLSLVLTIFFPPLLLNYYFFRQGGSAEELCIPLLMILLYQALKSVKNLTDQDTRIKFSNKEYFWQGLAVALVFLTKFSLLGPWIAFYVFLIVYLLIKKEFKELFQLVLYSGMGFLLGLMPWLIYFLVTGALADFFEVYILINSGAYNNASASIVSRIFFIFTQLVANLKYNLLNLLFLAPVLAVIPMLKAISAKRVGRMFIFSIVLSTVVFIYIGMKTYEYYFLFYMAYGVFGLLLLGKILLTTNRSFQVYFDTRLKVILPVAASMSFLIILANNPNVEESLFYPMNPTVSINNKEPAQPAQVLFAEYMHSKSSQPTLLNYGFLDGGFYRAANILPTERHFELQNLDHNSYPDNSNGQTEAIQQKRVQFFVMETFTSYKEAEFESTGLLTNYKIALSHSQSRDHRDYTYWLFELKE